MSILLIMGGTGFFWKLILDSFKRDELRPCKNSKVVLISRDALRFKKCYLELPSIGISSKFKVDAFLR